MIFCLITLAIIYAGVQNGIERVSKLMMPVLVLLSVVIAIYSVTRPGAIEGVKYFLVPNVKNFSWMTGIVGTLILLVGLINFFHFLIGSFLNRTKEYSIMKMAGCNWKQQFCLLFVQSLIVVVISSFLVIWGIELIGNRMDFLIDTFVISPSSNTSHIPA